MYIMGQQWIETKKNPKKHCFKTLTISQLIDIFNRRLLLFPKLYLCELAEHFCLLKQLIVIRASGVLVLRHWPLYSRNCVLLTLSENRQCAILGALKFGMLSIVTGEKKGLKAQKAWRLNRAKKYG